MNLKELMTNPAGKGDSSMTNRAMLLEILDSRYYQYIKEKDIKCKFYKELNSNSYYVVMKLPTMKSRDNSYDIVFHLYDENNEHSSDNTIVNYNIKVFSNCPSFIYTFAKVYNDNGLFINFLSKLSLTANPEVRNRYGVINHDKYLYFAAKYLYESRTTLLNKSTLTLRCITFSKPVLLHDVRTFDQIMNEYRKAEKALQRKTKKEKVEKSVSVVGRDLDDNKKVKHKRSVGVKPKVKAKTSNNHRVTKR